jgi:hypothetical protein
LLHGGQDPLGHAGRGGSGVVLGDDDGELVTAEAGDEVGGPDTGVQAGSQFDEEGVASFMSECVVHVLEIVDVDEEDTFVVGPAVGPGGERRRQTSGERGTVGESGERVVGGLTGEGQMALVEGGGHAVEGFGQLPQLVATGDGDAVAIVTGLKLQDALMHGGHRVDEIAGHPPAEIHRGRHGQPEQAGQRHHEIPFEVGAAGQPLVDRIE